LIDYLFSVKLFKEEVSFVKKIVLIDGNSILNRAFYGLSGNNFLQTSDGIHTNAVYGFLNILSKYLTEEKPDYIAVAFDMRAKTFRHIQYEEYKANRKAMPEELAEQFPIIKEVLDAMNIKRIELEGFEGDDILGTLAKETSSSGVEAVIVTGDKDFFQLIDKGIRIKYPSTKNGKTNTYEYDKSYFFEKYGIEPEQFIDVKALMGDSSDNVPGIKGIGEKTAISLIKEYDSLEGIYKNIESITKKALKQKLIDDKVMAFLSKDLVTIKTDIKGLWNEDEFKFEEPDKIQLKSIFEKLQFKSFIKKFNLETVVTPASNDEVETNTNNQFTDKISDVKNVITDKDFLELSNDIEKSAEICLFCNSDEIVFVFISDKLIYMIELKSFSDTNLKKMLKWISSDKVKKIVHDYKSLILLLNKFKVNVGGVIFDTKIAGYLCNPALSEYSIETMCDIYLSVDLRKIEKTIPSKDQYSELSLFDAPVSLSTDEAKEVKERNNFYNSVLVKMIYPLYEKLNMMIDSNDQRQLLFDVEMPLSKVLASMEIIGFKINIEELADFSKMLGDRMINLQAEIFEEAGEEFNINSPKQLGVILFEKMKLPTAKKTKTGFSTNVEVLEYLAPFHRIANLILQYRQFTKLKSTYADGLRNVADKNTERIHSSFNQTISVTGRISSTEPNLQNIPIKYELGREIRKVFIPDSDEYLLTDADYSQIELRILAHISGDEAMILAFNSGEDIHSSTASKIFEVPVGSITSEMRAKAKVINYGIIYGMGEFSLSKDLGISRNEAKEYIDEYLSKYPKVRQYMSDTVEFALEHGYVQTILKRRRYIPELNSSNQNIKAFGRRIALNTPIQGSAADIIKLAMVKVYNALNSKEYKSRLILQVHDELIIETHISEKEQVEKLLKDCMENAITLNVPIIAGVKSGKNWLIAH
jgi:DNA polymerase-1